MRWTAAVDGDELDVESGLRRPGGQGFLFFGPPWRPPPTLLGNRYTTFHYGDRYIDSVWTPPHTGRQVEIHVPFAAIRGQRVGR